MKISIALLVLMMPLASLASDLRDSMYLCSSYSKLAKVIMEKRQEGESLESILDRVTTSNEVDVLLASAYSKPIMLTDKWKLISINRFSNEAMAHCIKMMPK